MRTLLFKTAKGIELYEVQDDETSNIELVSTNPEEIIEALIQDAMSTNPTDRELAKELLWGVEFFGIRDSQNTLHYDNLHSYFL